MQDRASGRQRRLLRSVGALLAILLLFVTTFLVAGILMPSIPYAGFFGTTLVAPLPGYVWLTMILTAVLGILCTSGLLRRLILIISILSAIGLVLPVWSIAQTAKRENVVLTGGEFFGRPTSYFGEAQPDEVVPYARDLGEVLTARIFRPVGRAPKGGWPVLVYVHGGGWVVGSNAGRSKDWRWFADNGWMVVSVGYSLSGDRRHLWNRVTDQLGCALAWTNANIGARDGNPTRLALVGDSAGGNLVMNLGYSSSAGRARSICGGTIPVPRAIIADYPAPDLKALFRNTYPWKGEEVRRMSIQYTGGTPQQYPDRYAAVASATYVHPGAPRTLLLITGSDHLVPVDSMRAFASSARASGVDVKSVEIPYGAHGYDVGGMGNQIFRQVSLRFLNRP